MKKIIEPIPIQEKKNGWHQYELPTDDPAITYRFNALRQALDHWHIDESSVMKKDGSKSLALNALQFITELKTMLNIPDTMLPIYMEEVTSTLSGLAFKVYNESNTAEGLVAADFQTVEHAMTEGHPCFVANNGRLGFKPG